VKIVELPFLYRIGIIPPRCRKAEPHLVRDKVLVEIPEVTAADAPFGVEWVQQRLVNEASPDTRDKYYPDGAPRMISRVYDGRYYHPIVENKLGEKIGISVDEFLVDVANPKIARGLWAHKDGQRWPADRYPALPIVAGNRYSGREKSALVYHTLAETFDCGRLGTDDREQRMAEAVVTLQRSLLFIDGEVWSAERAAEPWIGVALRMDKIEIFVGYMQDVNSYVCPFRADRLIEARDYAASLSVKTGFPVQDLADLLIIHNFETVLRDEARMTAEQISNGLGANIINCPESWPSEAIAAHRALLDLRSIPERNRDLRWVATVFLNAEVIHSKMIDMPQEWHYGRELADGVSMGVERWLDMKSGRPDLVDLMKLVRDDDDALGAGLTL